MLNRLKRNIVRFIAGVCLILIAATNAYAGVTTIKAKLDSTSLLMGNMTTLHLEVVRDKAGNGSLPLLDAAAKDGYISICGDSVELRTDVRRDTADLGNGRIQINYQVPLQSFDSGFYRLPQFVYVDGNDSVRSNRVTLKVYPVQVSADDPIAGFTDPVAPESKNIFDNLPDWVIDYWWLWLLIVVLAALLIAGYIYYRKTGSVLPPSMQKPQPTPYEVAMRSLRQLKQEGLWEKGLEKEYFTRLIDILRVYLDRRFGINAMEMTTRQIKQTLSSNPEVRNQREYIARIMDIADYVKFAGVRPMPADSVAAYDDAVRFVEETKPVEPDPEESNNNPANPTPSKEAAKQVDNKKGGAK